VNFDIAAAVLWIAPLLLALVCHEWAHGYVAFRRGDDTAAMMGRLTLNPLAHIDPMGTILLPAMCLMMGGPMFGWAKPVPVAFHRLDDPRRDMVLVAAAGPAMNLVIALVSALLLRFLIPIVAAADPAAGGFAIAEPLAIMCTYSVQLNVLLAVLNMLPVPPLDGGRVAVGLLPHNAAVGLAQLEPYGMFIVIGLMFTGLLGSILRPVMGLVYGLLSLVL
jgi:Zn-dependent protease